MSGKLFFAGALSFACGLLLRTLYHVPWVDIALLVFIGLLCSAAWWLERRLSLRTQSQVAAIVATICFAATLGMIRVMVAPIGLPVLFKPFLTHEVSFTGLIVADPDIREKNQQLVLEVDQQNVKTDVLVFDPLTQTFEYGDVITARGILMQPAPFLTDTNRVFRYDHYLAKKGIFSTISRATVTKLQSPRGLESTLMDALFFIKHTFVAGLSRALSHPYDELATGLLTGNQHSLGDALVTTLALSGLIWVVVLSGYHVTILAQGTVALFAFLPKRFALVIAVCTIAAIVIMTGASAPSLRGSIMAGFALFAEGTHRTYDAIRALLATLIIVLLWNPLLLAYDQGFQLSVIVTPAIIIAVPILETRLMWLKWPVLRKVAAVSIVAQLACLPLILWQTGQLSPWAIPANMFVMEFVPIVMMFSVIAGVAGVIAAPAAPTLAIPAHILLSYILTIAKLSAALPYGNATLPPFPFFLVIVMYGFLVGILWWLKQTVSL